MDNNSQILLLKNPELNETTLTFIGPGSQSLLALGDSASLLISGLVVPITLVLINTEQCFYAENPN